MAAQLSLYFPAIEETASTNLNDYTFEELAQYDIIYLSGFTWDDRAEAEALILRLSESGVRIVIEADGIPDDASSRDQSFLGVTRNAVTFSNGYPDLETADGLLDTDLFPPGDTQWETVYLEGLDEVRGTVLDQGMKLPFYGTVKNENIVMIGLNLAYFYALTGDASAEKILSEAMELPVGELPVRRIVPVELTATDDTITAVVPEDEQEVNLTLAYHDLFDSDRTLTAKNHLLYVAGGTTVIRFRYPWLGPGVCVSLLGLVLAGILLVEKRCGIKSAPVIK
jgi:uncharacterized membrane protein